MTIAALLTCHDRVDKTLRCLEALAAQPFDVHTFLVDAASSDGTADAVERRFPDATVLRRGSEVFWNQGMRIAFAHARDVGFDHYLWLNDDTTIDRDALQTLLETERAVRAHRGAPAIIVGSSRDPETGALTYGGVHRPDPRRPMHFELLEPGDEPRRCETMNGNCVLVPSAVAERVGNLDATFTHSTGDFDYGLRAGRKGCEVWLTPGTIAECARNPTPAPATSLREQLDRMTGPKGLPPREWAHFVRRWAGPLWPLYTVSPYVRRSSRWLRQRR